MTGKTDMKLIGRCKDCRWWRTDNDWAANDCSNPNLAECVSGDDVLSYPYSEGGTFEPGPMFGCVHWEAKP